MYIEHVYIYIYIHMCACLCDYCISYFVKIWVVFACSILKNVTTGLVDDSHDVRSGCCRIPEVKCLKKLLPEHNIAIDEEEQEEEQAEEVFVVVVVVVVAAAAAAAVAIVVAMFLTISITIYHSQLITNDHK